MLKANTNAEPVKAVLLMDQIVDGEHGEAGEVIELRPSEFKYLETYNRVAAATPENVARVKAEVARAAEVANAAKARGDELTSTKARLAAAEAELATLKKGK
jgi:hypothetical protein